ncbi:uncharacterized protein LOC129749509 [Uranotaenia lowii]|uniref:uncharacterized protein LOC129749509 n=1 Tax=Uranotaenia lowii TaxID=190385 RepID=UPI002479D491|nr:uncharacterized protein LOC129749509 [Uranotaenia lowii]
MKLWIGLLLVGLAIEGRAQLTCFVCENCPDPFNQNLFLQEQCPPPVPTIVTPPNEGTTLPPAPTPSDPNAPTMIPPPVLPPLNPGPGPAPAPPGPGPVPQPPEGPIITPPPVGRKRRDTEAAVADIEERQVGHRCFVLTHNGVTRRGCTTHGNDHLLTCRNLNGGIQPAECRVCDWAGCNNGNGLTVSIAALMAALLVALRLF